MGLVPQEQPEFHSVDSSTSSRYSRIASCRTLLPQTMAFSLPRYFSLESIDWKQ
jgi:hypothetical protein